MKKIIYGAAALAFFIGFAAVIVSCGSSNSPSSPAATPTPSAGTATATPIVTVNSGPLLATPIAAVTIIDTVGTTSDDATAIRFAANSASSFWISDPTGNDIQRWTTSSGLNLDITTFNSGATFYSPAGIGVDPSTGNVYACDLDNGRIVVFNSLGSYLKTFTASQFTSPDGVAINSGGTVACVLDLSLKEVLVFTIGGTASSPTFTYQTAFGSGTLGTTPANLSFDSNNNIWIADDANVRIVEYSGAFVYQTAFVVPKVAGSAYSNGFPYDVVVDHSGYIYVADEHSGYIQVFNSSFTHVEDMVVPTAAGVALDYSETYVYGTNGGNYTLGYKIR
jgi:sugar lactone lactonase YvrE